MCLFLGRVLLEIFGRRSCSDLANIAWWSLPSHRENRRALSKVKRFLSEYYNAGWIISFIVVFRKVFWALFMCFALCGNVYSSRAVLMLQKWVVKRKESTLYPVSLLKDLTSNKHFLPLETVTQCRAMRRLTFWISALISSLKVTWMIKSFK